MEEPPYEVIKATKKAGFVFPEDRLWYKIDCNKVFECHVILQLKKYSYTENKNKKIYYMTQCPKCLKIYWHD